MLKLCWDCIFGPNEPHNDGDGRTLNGYPLLSTPHRENEMAFRLPRPLQNGDIIGVTSEMKQDRQRFCIGLALGENYVDKNNMACEVEANFVKDIFIIRTVLNGQIIENILEQTSGNPSSLLPESISQFTFEFEVNPEGEKIYISIGPSYLTSVSLNHDLSNTSYLLISDDVVKVKEIYFKYV